MSINMAAYIDRHRKPGNMCRVRLNIHSKCRLRASKSSRTDSESVDFLKQLILKLTQAARTFLLVSSSFIMRRFPP